MLVAFLEALAVILILFRRPVQHLESFALEGAARHQDVELLRFLIGLAGRKKFAAAH